MNLDEEFEKMYGGSGAASAAPDLEEEFAKTYGGEQKPRAWEEGDGGSARLPEGETNEWGGNLRNEGRKVLIRRDKDGKVNGYSTTSSIPVKDADGKIAIVPTVVDGKELTPDEAVRHYEETGEHWGKADDEDSARKIAQAVHERHAEDNQKSWNEYIHAHWDEMADGIRNDPGTRYQHKKRTGEETSLMERLANDDSEDDVKKWKSESDYEEVTDAMGLPIGRQPISRSGKSDEDALAAIAKEAGLADWQVERIRRGSKDAAEMRKNLAYVAGNRVGGGTDDGKKGGKLTDYIRSAAGAVTHAIADRIPDVTRLAGTVLGGEGDVEQPVMVDDQYSRKEDEDVRQWARRKGIHLNRKNFDAWNEFFKWEAPVEGKEGMRESRSFMAPGNRTKSWDAKSFGDKLVAIANEEQADLEKFVPRHLTGNAVMNFVEDTASGIGGFMFAGPLMIPTAGANSYQRTREEAVRAGKSDEEARGMGIAMGAFDAALTAAFYAAPVKKWMKSKGMRPVENFKSGSYTDMRRSFGNYFAKQAVLDQSAAALEAGAIMGVQSAGDRLGEMLSQGKDVDLGDIAITGIEGAAEGVAVGLVMGGAHILGARRAGAKYYDAQIREAVKTPEGVVALARLNPDGTAAFCEAFERGGLASAKEVDAAGLPPMKAADRVNYYQKLRQLGISSSTIRKNTRIGGSAPEAGMPDGMTPVPDVPPSTELSERIRGMGGEPVKFSIPQGADGKPKFTLMAWRDNRTGKEGKNRIAIDEKAGVAIMDNGDGTFTSYDNLQNAVDSDSLDGAIENANELALAQQYTNIERQKKIQVIQNEHAANFGDKNVVAFPTMAEAVRQIDGAIRAGSPILGITSVERFTNPANGFREDRQAFHTPDGTTVMIVDNIDSPADVRRLLRHEIVGHGGPNSEFGDGVDEFLASVDSEEMSSRRQKLIEQGMAEADVDSPRGKREIFANMLQERAHNPNVKQRIGNWLNDRARKIGAKKTYSDADIEVMAARWEKEARGTNGSMDLREPGDRFEFIELAEEAPRETHENAPTSVPSEKGTTSRPNETAQPTVKEETKSAPSKPVNERNIVEKLTDKAEAQEIPLSEVEVSDSRIPQFKEGADPETGEVEPLTGEPYDLVSNPIVVMEFRDGKKVVVTGRHRYGLYKRSGRKTIAARVIREADGWTVKDAMAIDAIGNIIDEKGTEKDYVKYFDEAKPTRDEAKSAGFLDRPKGQRAFSIYEGATADTKQLIDWEGAGGDGKISVDQAGIISAAAPKGANPRFGAVQRILTQKALGGLRGKKLGILARSLAEEAKNRKETPKVGGEMQLDLFTSEEDQALLAMEDKRADYRVKKSGEYNRIAEVLRTAVSKGGKLDLNGEYAKELGITDPKDRNQLIAARDKAIERANYWENAVVLDEADKASMDEAINAKSGAEAAKREEIQKKAAEKLAAVKEKRTGKKSDAVVSKTETTTPATAEEKAVVEKTEVQKMSDLDLVTAYHKDRKNGELADEVSRRGIYSSKRTSIIPYRDADGTPRVGTSPEVTTFFNSDGYTIAKFDAGEKPEYDEDGIRKDISDKDATFILDSAIYSAPTLEEALERGAQYDLGKGWQKRVRDNYASRHAEWVKSHPEESDAKSVKTLVKSSESTPKKSLAVALSEESITDAIPVDARDGLINVYADDRYGKGAHVVNYAPGSEDEIKQAVSGLKKTFAGSSVMTSDDGRIIVIPRKGDKSKTTTNATPKVEKGKFKSVEEAEKARKEREALAALFGSPEFDPEYERQKADVNKAVDFALNGNPVAELSGNEFAPTGKNDLVDRVEEFFKSIGGKAVNEELGEVLLNRASVKSSLGHGIGREKAAAFAAVPAVIQNGVVFDRQKNWKGRGVDSFVLAAPIKIGNEMYVCEAIVEQKSNGNERRFYLHEVNLQSLLSETIKTPTGGAGNGKPARPVRSILAQLARKFNGENSDVERYIRWTDKYHLNPYKKSHVKEFERKNGVQFASDEFDPATFQKRVGAMAVLAKRYVDNGIGTFEEIVSDLRKDFPEKFGNMKPYLRGIWNAVADQMNLPDVSREQATQIFDKITNIKESENGNSRTTGDTDGPVLDGAPAADVAPAPEGGSAGSAPNRNGEVEPVSGVRDGGERHAADVPVVGHDVVGSAGGVSEGDGERGRGNTKEGQDVSQDAAAEPGVGSAGELEPRVRLDPGDSDRVQARVKEEAHAASPDKPSNYVITAEDEAWLNTSTSTEKVANNMAVIKLLASLAEEGRTPTPEERTMMARYVGFGGFPQIVDQKYKDAYKNYGDIPSGELPVQTQAALKKLKFGLKGFDIYREMRQYLTPDEFDAIRQAMINAFYTPIDVCRSMHNALKASGFNGGRMLETSAGVGNMVGTGNYDGVPHWTAIELDKTTGKILEYLYPEANVKIQGFQEVIIPKNFIDATISNVPFSNDIHPYDPEYAKYDFNLHDYFFAKTVDTLRPGGVAALISSTGTLDKTDKTLIRFMEEHGGQIVGALRLPNGHQHKNSGTEVAADLIFIQKVNGRADNSAFSKSGQLFGIKINDYFVQHPEMIFGTPEAGRSMYGNAPALKFKATRDPLELDAAIRKAADGLKYLAPNEAPASAPLDLDADMTGLRRGNIGIIDGKIVKREGDVIVPIDMNRWTKTIVGANGVKHHPLWPESLTKKGVTLEKAVHDVMRLRTAYHEYIDAQKTMDEENVKLKRASLNAVYDVMISRYKHLNEGPIARVFDLDDADGIILQNLESYDMVPDGVTKGGKPKFKKANFRKSDALMKRTLFRATKADKADNVLDGLRISLNENGGVNLARIAELTGKTKEAVSAELMASGHVFQNPSTGGLETRDEYLSGSVRRKLREARAAAEVDPSFKKNIEELEKVQPEDKPATKIKYQLGQKFIPNEMYVQFLSERIFGTPENPARKVAVGYDEKKDTWVVSGEGLNSFWRRKCPDGTDLEDILVRIFNGSSLTVKDRIDDGGGKYHYVPNPQKTQAVEALRDDLTAELSKWMVATPERAKQIERAYNDKMNDNVERKFDTSLLTLDGISDDWAKKVNTPGYEHQKRSITRGVFGGNLYIQHCVGAGKSFEMFSICMQLRRLGLARKPMLTVPNHMVESGQVLREFKEAYPGANILVATTKDLNSTNRRKFLAKAANGDWDCIVVPHSSFSLIGMDPKVQADYIKQEIEDLREMVEAQAAEGKKKGNAEKRIEKKIASKMEKMKKLLDQSKKDSTVPFENIGVDYLFVDEAHNFKGLDITTKMSNVSGVTGSVSQRAQDLEMKCRYLSKLHGGDKGVIFASGTPISNSISESYTNARFMNPTRMREMGVYRFDDWAKSFGVVETKAAPRASGKGYQEKTRFARFQNLVELKQGNFAYADIVLDSDLNIPRPFMAGFGDDGKAVLGKPIVHKIPATDFQKKYVESLDKRLDSFKGKFDPKIDNPLKVVTEGRLLAIDPALLGLKDEHRRLECIADNVFRIWQKSTGITGKDKKTVLDGTQLIFCDSGVPKPKKFSKVVRTADGGFATRSGNYWALYVSDVDANGMRHGKAVRSDGVTINPRPFADHSQNGQEDISSVYAAFDEMAQMASEYGKAGKEEKGLGLKEYQKSQGYKVDEPKKHLTHAKEPEGEPFDINAWLDENADAVGYDVRFENPYATERSENFDFDEIEESPEEEIVEDEGDEDAPEKDQDEANNGDVAVENMLRGKFNIYAYLKKALVKRGIPADEIVFIHDAEDAKAKRAMFEKFNADGTNFRGGPRILIGNTPKMGEGANVQRRLVAIHHADIPWKPAWLTQRDGRGIRAGNLNESIGIHRYVTENTFDVYSYDKVSGKQQFINQVQSHDMSQDEIEDVDDAVLAAEEAKAAAAGPIGKYMMAKTKLEQGIRKAELTLANQQSDIFNAQSGLEWDEQNLQTANRRLEADKAMLDKFAAAKGDQPFGIEVIDNGYPEFGKTLTDNDELQQFLMKKVNEYVRKGAEDGMVGKLYGMPVWWKEIRGQEVGRLTIGAIGMESQDIPIINRVAPIAKSTVSTFKAAVTQATSEKRLDRDRADVANAQKRFDASKDALAKLKIDETLPTKIEDMKIELATTMNILKAKDDRIQAEARKILNERIEQGRNAEAAAIALVELNRPQPIERQLMDLEKEAAEVEFNSPEFNPNADKPANPADDKTFGFTNEEVAFALKAAGMEPPKHVTKPDEIVERQADALLSNREYMRKLAHAVYQKNRATRDYENLALGIYTEQCKEALNTAKSAYDEMAKMLEDLPAETEPETVDLLKKSVKELKAQLLGAQRDFREAAGAKIGGASEQGRALRSNRILVDGTDYSYAGIRGMVEAELGGKPVSAEMDAEIGRLAENFKDLDERSRNIAVERLKAFSQKVVDDLKRGGKERSSGPKSAGNELKRVMRNYEDAMTQVQVHADEAGGTLIGLADQLYPSWGKWLKAIGEYHCYLNPDITEQGVIDAIREDVGRYLEDGFDETTVRDILTGFGHNYRQSRYDSQRKMNDLKAQALAKRQRDYMIENGKLPPQTGMVRDEPSDETRALRKEVQQIKKDIDEQEGGPRALKGALSSAKTRLRNTIADLERAIANGEKIERSHRTLMEDAELQMLQRRRDELREQYDALFGEKATLTDEQRRERAEKALRKVLERALERLGRAYGGDFSAPTRASRIDSPTIQSLREEIAQTNRAIRDLKDAAYPDGTPEEIAKKNARRMAAREEAIQRMQARIISGDIRPQVKKAPPMPPEMQERYDALGKELKRAHQKLRQLRQEAKDSLKPTWLRKIGEAWRFMDGIQKMAMASLDFTQVGNQTGTIAVSHPVVAYRSFMQSLPSFLNETNAENIDNELLSDPIVKEAVDQKWLHWKRAGEFAENRGDRVEFFDAIDRGFKVGGRILKLTDVPLYGTAIANSDRLYATYINTAAANLYSLIVKDTGLFPKGASSFEKRVVADMVNVMTGSGTLSKQTRAVLGKVMWAPGLVDSQFKRSIGYTMWHPFTADSSEDGSGTGSERAKLAYIGTKEFVRSHVGAMLLGGLMLALFGSDDEKYRFWHGSLAQKLIQLMAPRIGHTSLDFTGGESAFYRLGEKLATGVKETGSGRHTPIRDFFGEIAHFMQGRINPFIGNIVAAAAGRDYAGTDYGPLEVVASFAPISIKEAGKSIYENGIQDGNYVSAAIAATLVMFGIGKGTYRKEDYKILSNRFREDFKEMTDVANDPLLSDEDKKDMIANMIKANNLLDPKNSGAVMSAVKAVDKEDRAVRKAEERLALIEQKDGRENEKIRYELDKARVRLEEAKQKVLRLIRERR